MAAVAAVVAAAEEGEGGGAGGAARLLAVGDPADAGSGGGGGRGRGRVADEGGGGVEAELLLVAGGGGGLAGDLEDGDGLGGLEDEAEDGAEVGRVVRLELVRHPRHAHEQTVDQVLCGREPTPQRLSPAIRIVFIAPKTATSSNGYFWIFFFRLSASLSLELSSRPAGKSADLKVPS